MQLHSKLVLTKKSAFFSVYFGFRLHSVFSLLCCMAIASLFKNCPEYCYEVFWILLVVLILPRFSQIRAAVAVCLATCGVEFLQLWTPPFLQAMRATLPGRLILGNHFSWSDFISYFVGSFLGWLWVRSLHFTCFRL